MIFEKIAITDRTVVVSYSGDELSLTPEQKAALSDFWARRIERLTRAVLGDFTVIPLGNRNPEKPQNQHP